MSSMKIMAASLAVASLTLTACNAKDDAEQGTQFVLGNGAEPASIDPGKIEGSPGGNIANQLFQGLTALNSKGEVVAGAATSWSASNNNKTWTFELRDGIKWSNGEPVTAADFAYAWKRVADPALASQYAWYMEKASIVNAKAAIAGDIAPSELGVFAVDADTLRVELEKAVPYFPSMASHYTMYPVSKAAIDTHGDQWTRPANMVSNGAYKLDSWMLNERMVLVRNEHYWDNANTTIDEVVVLPIEDENSELARYESGEIHVTLSVPNAEIPRLKREYANEFTIYPNLAVYYYDFNTEKAPMDDARVRKALSLAIDRDILVNNVTKGGQTPAYSFVPPFVAGFSAAENPYSAMSQADRDAAAVALLAEAGYGTDNPLTLDFLYNTSDGHKSIAVAVSQMWQEKLGVSLNLENQEWKTFLTTKQEGHFHVARSGWGGDYNEASTFLDVLTSSHGNNDSNFKNDAYDQIMADAKSAANPAAKYVEAEALLAAEMPVMPIYYYTRTRMISPKLAGWPVDNAQDLFYVKDLSFKAE